jgi:hypothetical protein
MGMKVFKVVGWSIAAMLVAGIGVLAWYSVELYRMGPRYLVACYDGPPDLVGLMCKEVLIHARLDDEGVSELNKESGALYAVSLKDPAAAQEMLALFISKGVDVNAGHERSAKRTALHSVVAGGEVERVDMLLRHGARPDIKDANGSTPLDEARGFVQRMPSERRAEIVKLLEGATER